MASRVSRFKLNPSASMAAAAPSRDSGMLRAGTATARSDPRKMKITRTTSRLAMPNLLSTLPIAASMNTVTSYGIAILAPSGKSSPARIARTSRDIVSGLPPGVAITSRYTAGSPFMPAIWSRLCAPISTVAMSSILTRVAPRLTTSSRKPLTLSRLVSARTFVTTIASRN
ncbi:hypothetical protein D3C85_1005930 [compost metagenome]